ncbi:MAG: sigma-70 family RNA polymerase sigma factor [Firmicutes bacterium]|nr:sigma-70 family RNA polymerase sigma factor [Bacillota bacterium]
MQRDVIELLRQKNEDGLDYLLRYYGPLLKYIIAPILDNEHDCDDCLSKVLFQIWEKIEQFDENRGSWNGWITVIARNTALNYRRNTKRHSSIEEISENTPSPAMTPEETLIKQEQREAVKHAIEQLPPKDRNLFYRKYYYLQSTAQIASELGMTERAVEGKLYRLKKQLRKMLGGGKI